jgi:hypothetical protein
MRNVLTALVVALSIPAAAFAADSSAAATSPAPVAAQAKVAPKSHAVKAVKPAAKTQEVKPAVAHEKQGRKSTAKKVRASKTATHASTETKGASK